MERIGHYTIVSELGRGGMGVVYKAHEESLNRFVAIKVLGEHLAEDHSYVQRFAREAQSAAKLNHPNIVQIYAIDEDQGRHYFVMEYITGTSLQRLLRDRGKMDARQAARLILQTAAGLSAAHEAGVIHRDIKPANILITDRGLVKIADFGLALMASGAASRLTATGMFMGTPGYLSPEQCLDTAVDHRTDIYSLGVTFFEMLTGGIPFKADSPLALLRQIIEVEPPDVRSLNPDVDDEARAILKRMMAKKKEERYPSCQELITDLQRYLEEAGTSREEVSGVAAGTSAAVVAAAPMAATGPLGAQPTVRSTAPARGATPPPAPLTAQATERLASSPPPAPPAVAGPTVLQAASPPDVPYAVAPPPAVEMVHTPPPSRGFPVGLIVALVVIVGFLGVVVAAAVAWKVGLLKHARTTTAARTVAGDTAATTGTGSSTGAGDVQPGAGGTMPTIVAEGTSAKAPAQVEVGGQPGTYPQAGGSQVPPPGGRPGAASGAQPRSKYLPGSGNGPLPGAQPQPPAVVPPPRGVVVVGVGERLLAGAAESFLEKSLRDAGARVIDEKALPEVDQLLQGEASTADLARALKGRAHYLVVARAEFVTERQLHYMGRSDTATQSRLHITALDLATGEPLSFSYDDKIEYTSLTVERKVEEQLRPQVRQFRMGVEER